MEYAGDWSSVVAVASGIAVPVMLYVIGRRIEAKNEEIPLHLTTLDWVNSCFREIDHWVGEESLLACSDHLQFR